MNVKTLITWIIIVCALTVYGCTELIANDEFDNMKAPKAFNKCKACHGFDKNKLGPHLKGLLGRPIAGVEGYRYSKALKQYAEEDADGTWNVVNLQMWLIKPRSLAPKTKMIFAGIKKQEELDELITYFEIEGGVDAGQRLHKDEDE